ncbi:tripartite tricarboxylate transporter substrate binding protein [Roseomonas sp. AR75]|uniref:Bug family tripartite tricarboxylate transporter substrate binding protein n=1 Tax=Roseomonas sp. AR75 TaxID=2562311 RepID=UPI001484EC43|nr:tripartite tricarboxylate transporter substrate binding protein [Roseomonas sp. AR75]
MTVTLPRRGLLAALLLPATARAQTDAWPSRAITMVVPFAPGGPVDNVARPLAEGLRRQLGQPVVAENRAGAGGVVGTRLVAAARPDGYTLLVGSPGPLVIAPAASADAPDPLKALAPIALIAISPQILVVNAELPATTLAEFIALARTRPGGLNMGSAGIGTTPHLAMELLGQIASVRFEHIPYRGTGAALPDLVGGKIDGLFGDISAVLPLLRGGRVRALAITGDRRSPLAPEVPSAAELGFPALRVRNFQALLAPAGTPAPILDRVAAAVTAAQGDEAVRVALSRQGAEAVPSSPAQLTAFLQEERATWDPIVKSIGLTLQ